MGTSQYYVNRRCLPDQTTKRSKNHKIIITTTNNQHKDETNRSQMQTIKNNKKHKRARNNHGTRVHGRFDRLRSIKLHQRNNGRLAKCCFHELHNIHTGKVSQTNNSDRGEFWIKINTENKTIMASPYKKLKNFMNIKAACEVINMTKEKIKPSDKSLGEFRCFNNNNIEITGTIQLLIKSGSLKAKGYTILLVDINTINNMGRNIMDKLGLHLTMRP